MSSQQSEDPSANAESRLLRDIDQACDRFEAAWCAGLNPLIEGAIEGVNEPLRSRLLRELVALEISYRRRSGQTPMAALVTTLVIGLAIGGPLVAVRQFQLLGERNAALKAEQSAAADAIEQRESAMHALPYQTLPRIQRRLFAWLALRSNPVLSEPPFTEQRSTTQRWKNLTKRRSRDTS